MLYERRMMQYWYSLTVFVSS